jgi:hypothetical protein
MSTGTLEQRVAALENAIAGLQGSEALSPNYLTLDAEGNVGANFSGVIEADGVTLPASNTVALAAQNEVAWQRTSDGALIADVGGYAGPSGDVRLILNAVNAANNQSEISLNATSDGGTLEANLTVAVVGTPQVFAGLNDGSFVEIIGEGGVSSFLQLAGASRELAIDSGASSLAYAASTGSATTTVNHNLGRAPIAVVATAMGAPGFTAVPVFNWFNQATTTFQINGAIQSAFTGNIPFTWIALG